MKSKSLIFIAFINVSAISHPAINKILSIAAYTLAGASSGSVLAFSADQAGLTTSYYSGLTSKLGDQNPWGCATCLAPSWAYSVIGGAMLGCAVGLGTGIKRNFFTTSKADPTQKPNASIEEGQIQIDPMSKTNPKIKTQLYMALVET